MASGAEGVDELLYLIFSGAGLPAYASISVQPGWNIVRLRGRTSHW